MCSDLSSRLYNEVVRNLEENACAISGSVISAAGPSMLESLEDLEPLSDNRVCWSSVEPTNKSYAARVSLVGRVVQAPGWLPLP